MGRNHRFWAQRYSQNVWLLPWQSQIHKLCLQTDCWSWIQMLYISDTNVEPHSFILVRLRDTKLVVGNVLICLWSALEYRLCHHELLRRWMGWGFDNLFNSIWSLFPIMITFFIKLNIHCCFSKVGIIGCMLQLWQIWWFQTY